MSSDVTPRGEVLAVVMDPDEKTTTTARRPMQLFNERDCRECECEPRSTRESRSGGGRSDAQQIVTL